MTLLVESLKIIYKNRKIEEICTIYQEAQKRYGVEMAGLIHQRIEQIEAIDSVEHLVQYRVGRCHALKGNRNGQFAMDLVHPWRLVFEKNESDVQIANVMEIVDYH